MTRLHMFGLVVATALFAVASTSAQAAGDKAAGKKLVYTCAGCHGVPGYTNAYPQYPVPKIAGQNEQYIVNALHGYQAGDRKHPTMDAQAESLSDTDIQDIAAYLSSLAPATPKLSAAGAKALDDRLTKHALDSAVGKKADTCFACHGRDGNAVDPQYPRLAGQYNLYLKQVLHEYKSGQRNNPIMTGMVGTLSEQDITDIVQYFSNLPSTGLVPVELDTLKGHIGGDK